MSRLAWAVKGLAVAAIAGSLMATMPQTTVALSVYECPDEAICLYSEHGGTGSVLEVRKDTADLATVSGWNDHARSVMNNSSDDWCLYRDENYKGQFRIIPPGEGINLTGELDRSVSSLRVEPDGGCGAA
jgi:Peptidase inhibitor family I36